jgi:hypothetical protein
MLRSLLGLTLLLVASAAPASFSQFVSLSPDNENKYQEVRPVITRKENVVTVRIPYRDGPKKYWLIVSDKPLRNGEQEFRDFIWKGAGTRTDIVLLVPLGPSVQRTQGGDIREEKSEIQLVLPYQFAQRAYIYHDFPTLVKDGGFYYTIDIPSYVKQ